ncbi:nuclease-related domain-containing protein [Solibacillus sp. FSL R5-0449]|uniref:nuclease-related domain-containing protein n=1 Tax=Solibacillus sp. FSL R5-0449 TaxID=2921639 RepID=UPI0030CA60EA
MYRTEKLVYLEALISRLKVDDEEFSSYQQAYYRSQAGLAGELKMQRTLADYHFPGPYKIFYNFECINEKGFSHQIDALIITTRFLLVVEVKQISGTLFYKPAFHEFARQTEEGVIENFKNPFDQAYRHQLYISYLLSKWGISLPVLYIVINANIRTKLDSSLNGYPIIHLSGLPNFLEKLYETNGESTVNLMDLERKLVSISRRLPYSKNVERDRLRNGVLCQNCDFHHVMYYHHGLWICPHCGVKSKEAIFLALHQYRLLIGDRITNRELRKFVGIDCKAVTSKLLKRLKFEQFGKGRGVYHLIPEDILERKNE